MGVIFRHSKVVTSKLCFVTEQKEGIVKMPQKPFDHVFIDQVTN